MHAARRPTSRWPGRTVCLALTQCCLAPTPCHRWDAGWLVQMADDADGLRFAFVWRSRQGNPANVLTQLAAQKRAVFLGEDEALRAFDSYV